MSKQQKPKIQRKSIILPKLEQVYAKNQRVTVIKPIKGDYSVVNKQGFILDYYTTYQHEEFYIVWLDGYNNPVTVDPSYITEVNEDKKGDSVNEESDVQK